MCQNPNPMNSYVAYLSSDNDDNRLSYRKYIVPRYQRPYAWEEEQIDDFLKTIMDGYSKNQSKFFGTMQFDVKYENESKVYEVVDGQQRLTTMLLFLQILCVLSNQINNYYEILYRNSKNANDSIAELKQKKYDEILGFKHDSKGHSIIDDSVSVFDANFRMLKAKFEAYYSDSNSSSDICSYSSLVLDYLVKKIYFVVLETEGIQLTEIVSIFNTINTTGMDLNSSDIFKFQYFDYLHKRSELKLSDDELMDKIQECYTLIDTYNIGKTIKDQIEMSMVLDVYKHCLCAKYNPDLDWEWLSKSNERFFEDLFKEALISSKYDELLCFDCFEKAVLSFVSFWEKLQQDKLCIGNPFKAFVVQLIKGTRYSRYWTLPFVYEYFNSNKYDEALSISYVVFTYLLVNSINYQKVINPVQTVMCNMILPRLVNDNCLSDVENIVGNIRWLSPYDSSRNVKKYFCDSLLYDGFDISKTWLVCLMVAIKKDFDIANNTVVRNRYFNWVESPYDIEHIYSRSSFINDDKLKEKRSLYNGIGNLVVMDRKINRDMGAKKILLPEEKYKGGYYKKSKYQIVRELHCCLETWSEVSIVKKGEDDIGLICDLLDCM